jgi:hypothetical protein
MTTRNFFVAGVMQQNNPGLTLRFDSLGPVP